MSPASPALLRRLAALLIRGPEAPYVLSDLDDAFDRDIARARPRWQAQWRYLVNVTLSAVSVTGARLRRSAFRLSWIDVRLGVRMLIKFPMLTAVSVFALAVGIPVALAPLHMVSVVEGHLPEDPAGQVQFLRYWRESTTFDDFIRWRTSLTSFETLGALRQLGYNVEASGTGGIVAMSGAEVTASTFDILRVHPLLGRTFGPGDEVVGAPAVVVVGYDLWQTSLGGQRDVVGQSLRIGGVVHEVIGVMPEGFLFPSRQHLWLPVRDPLTARRDQARHIEVFGRLAEGISAEQAQSELTSANVVEPGSFNEADRLIPEVVPMTNLTFGLPKGGLRGTPDFVVAQVLTLVPLLIACVNVGLLIFARTATRSSEFAVRTALGASRSRILTQVFTESLVLSLLATGAGLLLLGWLPGRALTLAGVTLPYWIDPSLTTGTVVRGLAVGVFSAVIAGVIPVLRATGHSVQRNIQRAQSQRSGVRFGGLSSVMIITDVAVAVIVVGFAAGLAQRTADTRANEASDGIQAAHYLSFELRNSGERARAADAQQRLVERLKAEPGVRAVAVASVLPRMDHPNTRIELAEGAQRMTKTRTAMVDPQFFAELRQPIVAGRDFDAGDLREGANAVIVNTSFVANLLDGANPIGQRLRFLAWEDAAPPSPWYEIVGVVGHLGVHSLNADMDEGVYRPMAPGSVQPVRVAVELGDEPMKFVPRLIDIARDADPQAVVSTMVPLNQVFEGDWYIMAAVVGGGLILVGVLLTLAASGIYAIMSFTVAQRTREIGIRVALGADRSHIVLAVAKRALFQICIGVVLGMTIGGRIFFEFQRDANPDSSTVAVVALALLPGVAIMALVGLVSCVAPTLRALRISPVEALRGDG